MLQRSHASKQDKECSNASILQCFNAPMLQSKTRNAPMLLFFNASTLPCFKAREGMLKYFYSSMLQRSHASKQEKECSNASILRLGRVDVHHQVEARVGEAGVAPLIALPAFEGVRLRQATVALRTRPSVVRQNARYESTPRSRTAHGSEFISNIPRYPVPIPESSPSNLHRPGRAPARPRARRAS